MAEDTSKKTIGGGHPSSEVASSQPSTVGHKIATAIGAALCVVLIPILIVNCILLFKGARNSDEVPSVGGVVPFIVLATLSSAIRQMPHRLKRVTSSRSSILRATAPPWCRTA